MKKVLSIVFLLMISTVCMAINVFANTGFEDAYELGSDQYFSGSISPAGDIDYIHFSSASTNQYNLAYNIYSTGTLDTYGYLYEEENFLWWFPRYELRDEDDDSGSGLNFRIEYDLDGYEDYFIKIRAYSSTQTGSYAIRAEPNIDSKYSTQGGTWIKESRYNQNYSPAYRKDFLNQEQTAFLYYILSDSLMGTDSYGNPLYGDDLLQTYLTDGLSVVLSLVALWFKPLTIPAALIGSLFYLASYTTSTSEAEELYYASNATTETYVVGNQVITEITFHDPVIVVYEYFSAGDYYKRYETNQSGNYMLGDIYTRVEYEDLREGY